MTRKMSSQPSTIMPKLIGIVPYFNFCKYARRVENYHNFIAHMKQFDVELVTVECIFPGQQYEVTQADNSHHIQLHADKPIWLKENLINIGLARFPHADAYGWFDADISFANPHWLNATWELLKVANIVQPFEQVTYLDAHENVDRSIKSFGRWWTETGRVGDPSSIVPGGCWIIRADKFQELRGLCEWHIVGGCDDFTAQAMGQHFTRHGVTTSAAQDLLQKEANHIHYVINQKIGCVSGSLFHHFHGTIANRAYSTRDINVLWKNTYDPLKDLTHNSEGVLQLADPHSKLQDDIERYFYARKEDE